jgi:hypothetical protein
MNRLGSLASRLIPAVMTAAGVVLVAAGLLSLTNPATAGVPVTPPAASPAMTPPRASPSPVPTSTPVGTATATATPAVRATATRVAMPALGIDLPVIQPPGGPDTYPLCDVAMYLQELSQPGEPGATYLYAHARTGMFLPILEASRVNDGAQMIGMIVQVYTSDDRLYLYEVVEVRRGVVTLDEALAERDEVLYLQTSEGPRGTVGKTQVIARPLSSGPADPAEAHPSPRPVVCG